MSHTIGIDLLPPPYLAKSFPWEPVVDDWYAETQPTQPGMYIVGTRMANPPLQFRQALDDEVLSIIT